jgi:hypothetical protein
MKRISIFTSFCVLLISGLAHAATKEEIISDFINKYISYHGTIAANLDGIQESGLIAHEGMGATYGKEDLDSNCKSHVYVTDNITLAWTYTQEALQKFAHSLDLSSEIRIKKNRIELTEGHPVIVGVYHPGLTLEEDDRHQQSGAFRVRKQIKKDRLFYISTRKFNLEEAIELDQNFLNTMMNQLNLLLPENERYVSSNEVKRDFIQTLRKHKNGSVQIVWTKMQEEFMENPVH